MISSMQRELQIRAPQFDGREVETIYFGGGTPSLLEAGEIKHLLEDIFNSYRVQSEAEITLEANPDDLDLKKMKEFAELGINRLSIGIQSFFDEDLRLMNRAHSSDQAHLCIEQAKTLFDNISIDLIYGIPGMSHSRWEQNISFALDFDLPHISAYALTVEPRTALKSFIDKGLITEVDEDMVQEQFHLLEEHLESDDFIHYEISNFGKPGYFSRNNTAYWQGKPYIGIGPSAHSYDGSIRSWNVRNNSKYINALNQGYILNEEEVLTKRDKFNEYIMTGLRTIWGVSLQEVRENFGPVYETYLMQQAKDYLDDLLLLEEGILRASKKGKFLTDGIASHLFMINLEK